MQNDRAIQKSLALFRQGAEPSFDTVAAAACTALLCDLSVQVLCLTQDQLRRWRCYVDQWPDEGLKIKVRDLNQATLAEWRSSLAHGHSDMTVLAGFHTARHRQEISSEYANALVDAAPAGLVVMA